MTRRDFFLAIGATVTGGVLMLVVGNINDGWLSFADKARNAADQATVTRLERKIDQMPSSDDIRELNQQLAQINGALAEIRSDIRVANRDMDQIRGVQSALRQRQRYLWDSVTVLCTSQGIACATQNASTGDIPPMPQPDGVHYARAVIRDKRHDAAGTDL